MAAQDVAPLGREYTRRLRALRLIAASGLLVIAWITSIGAAKVYRGLDRDFSSWIPFAVIAAACVVLAICLTLPFPRIRTATDLLEHRWLLAAVLSVGGSAALAAAPTVTFWPIVFGFLIYSAALPLRQSRATHWWREGLSASAAWAIVWSALGIATSEVGPHAHDEPALIGLIGLIIFTPFMLLSGLLRMRGRRTS
jgi:hypothetical protein